MYILELAVQAVRGFSISGRVALKPGYSVLQAGAGPTPLPQLISALVFNDGRGGDAAFIAPGAKAGKAGLTLLGNDQATYRLVRELGGAGALHRLNQATTQFEVVTQDAAETSQVLRAQAGMPPKTTFEQLFTFQSDQFPSRRPKPKGGTAAKAAPKMGLAGQQPVEAASDLGAAQARLTELQKEHALSKDVDQLQFKLDGVASQMFELEGKLKQTQGLKAAVQEAQASYAQAPTPKSLGLSEDILARLDRYPQLVQRRDEALARLEAEKEQAAQSSGPTWVEPLWRDPRFLGGAIAGALFLGLATQLQGYLRYVALLDIPAFGFAALVALRWVEDLQASTRTSRKGDFLVAREKKIHDDFQAEAAQVKAALHAAQVETVEELREVLAMRDRYAHKLEELKAQLREYEQNPEYASAAAAYQQLKTEQENINAQLLERGGGYVRDVREVEREIARVKESIGKARAPAAPAPGASSKAPVDTFEDPSPALMMLGADLFTCDVPALHRLLKERAVQYLSALTDRRYHDLEVDKDGKAFVLAPERKVSASELPGKDLDMLYLALRLTLVEKYCQRFKVPVVVEDVLPLVDTSKHALLARMLKHLGTVTQVLHLTTSPAFVSAADVSVQV
ncbi:MAG: ATP-binding protein [Myxococcota bacterium]